MRLICHKNFVRMAAFSGALLAACGKSAPTVAPAAAAVALKPAVHAKPLGDWTDNHADAVKQAKTTGKKILLYFTGSDWCINCWRLDDEVFSKPAFADYAAKNLILETVDLPIKLELPDEVLLQNLKLQEKYQAPNLPTLVLLDGEEKELAWMEGYRGEGVAGVIAELEHPKLTSAPAEPATGGQPLPLAPVGTAVNGATRIPNAATAPAVPVPVSPPAGKAGN